jgi:hypothetical protein
MNTAGGESRTRRADAAPLAGAVDGAVNYCSGTHGFQLA